MQIPQRRTYPNIILTPHTEPRPQSKQKTRRFSNKMMRAISIEEYKNGAPGFKCVCLTNFSMPYAVFVRDVTQPFSGPFFVCRDCAKLSRYEKQK